MPVEYVLVHFPEDRDVLADGDRVGVTNHTLMIQAGEYAIKMSGDGYAPESQDVVVVGTSIMRPLVVAFTRLAAATPGAGRAAGGGGVSGAA